MKFGCGKVIRDGMAQSPLALDSESLDLVITNALILDAAQGVIKADIGIKHGRIVGIDHAGNPLLQDGITMVIGAATEVIAGEGCIITAGGIDTHIHFICPQQIEHAIASGITTSTPASLRTLLLQRAGSARKPSPPRTVSMTSVPLR